MKKLINILIPLFLVIGMASVNMGQAAELPDAQEASIHQMVEEAEFTELNTIPSAELNTIPSAELELIQERPKAEFLITNQVPPQSDSFTTEAEDWLIGENKFTTLGQFLAFNYEVKIYHPRLLSLNDLA